MSHKEKLQTKELTLERCRPNDLDDFIALELDRDVMRYLDGEDVLRFLDSRQFDEQGAANPEKRPLMPEGSDNFIWTARRRIDNGFVGWFCLWPDNPAVAELGYRLHRDNWGQGLASQGAATLVNWGFATGGYERITACTMAANIASRRVLEKIGMTVVPNFHTNHGTLIEPAENGDVYYEISRTNFICEKYLQN